MKPSVNLMLAIGGLILLFILTIVFIMLLLSEAEIESEPHLPVVMVLGSVQAGRAKRGGARGRPSATTSDQEFGAQAPPEKINASQ